MKHVKKMLATTMLLVAGGVAQAAILDDTDWTKGDPSRPPKNWVLNGNAAMAVNSPASGFDPLVTLRLLEPREGQASTVWHTMKGKVPSFTFMAEVRVRFDPRNAAECPADGFTLVFANADTNAVGTLGGSLGVFNSNAIPQINAFEVNAFNLEGLGTPSQKNDCTSGKNETFALDVMGPGVATGTRRQSVPVGTPEKGGAKIGQVNPPLGMTLVNGGAYRYEFDADAASGRMTVYVTGLEDSNRQFQHVKVLDQKLGIPILDFEGRFGVTAGSGAAVMQVDVAHTFIAVPMLGP
jgi:hypothetical protein